MEKRRRIEAVNGEILLPEAIIHHILSFLSGKQAAQTSILSKSWYSAWSTRPNLDFDHRDISDLASGKRRILQGLWDSAKETMQRYEELNLKIENFKLCAYGSPRTTELIVKAMKLGVTDFHFEIRHPSTMFDLPREVFESETIIRLSLVGCKIFLRNDEKVRCSRLKSVSLKNGYLVGDKIWDIISSCPLIEELSLSGCLFVGKRSQYVASPFNVPINLNVFHKLKYLLLERVKINPLFFNDFSSRFPCLKDLTLGHCIGCVQIQISSPSLERISFVQDNILVTKFDVPCIRKFSFSSSSLPSLSLLTASTDWDSYISITCPGSCCLNSRWLFKLKKLLIELSPSKISLSLNIIHKDRANYIGHVRGLPKVNVENLALSVYSPSLVCSAFLDDVFRTCHPKFITQDWLPKSPTRGDTNNNFLKLLCKTLIQRASKKSCIPNRNMCSLHDLEEVNMQVFEENCSQWRPFSWKTLLDASENQENEQKIRFQLKWR